MKKEGFNYEKVKLKDTMVRFDEIITEINMKIKALPRVQANNLYLLEKLMKQYMYRLSMLERTRKKPYFARIDFKNIEEENIDKCYIGKIGVMDEDNNIVTVDWRAPIASMYYDSNIGKASYEAPEGTITGELLTKRQYTIENGELKSFQDVDTVSNDDFLKPYLGVSADNRLKNIVSTIQAEQNEIIRQPLQVNMVIQGVAGSGKTTVALHRIAYLVYNNIGNIEPNQYLVIGPSKFFVNYISNVLPDLDVTHVSQFTIDEIIIQLINEPFKLISDESKLITSIKNPQKFFYEKYKVSLDMKNKVDDFIDAFEKKIIPSEDFCVKGYKILSKKIVNKIYWDLDIDGGMKYDIVSKKIKKTELLLKKYIEDRFDNILLNVNEQYLKKIKVNDDDALKNEQKNFEYVKKELKNYCNTSLKKYLSNSKPKILNLYVEFLEYLKGFLLEEQIKIQKNIINIKNKEVEFEDLGIIMYLTYKIYGPKEFDKYRHTVIDEAQDLGDFNFYALSKILPNSTFSIFGDLAQSIYQYRGIENWDVITNKIFNNKCNLKYLLKSYRTTTEIMNSANNLVKYLGLSVAEPVIRHGVKVGYKKIENKCKDIEEIIKKYLIKDYSSIAIICKDKQEVFEIYEVIENKFLNIDVIVDTNTIYNGGICIITSYLAKGLEFDGVIITDASKEKYSEKNSIDMKLLYVSMTRALHELNVLYNNINKALEREIII